ncbi:MAG: pyrogallol hydroxytransferase large subunit, partial [Pseudomonadota bacterium]
MGAKHTKFRIILNALPVMFGLKARQSKKFREYISSRDAVVQIELGDKTIIKHLVFKGGRCKLKNGMHDEPDVHIYFKDIEAALTVMTPPTDYGEVIHAGKNFRVKLMGDEEAVAWFTQLAGKLESDGWDYGQKQPDGSMRYTQITNGGPLHVYVKDGKILRTHIIEFDDDDPETWTIEARGKKFSPQRKGLVAPHALAMKANVYAENRALYPMKRVDFDPDGERNPQNRGTSGYERISWDEALDIVSKEIMRQKRVHGPGSIAL